MKSTILSRRDLDFLLYEWLDIEKLTALDRFSEHSRETFDGEHVTLAPGTSSATDCPRPPCSWTTLEMRDNWF